MKFYKNMKNHYPKSSTCKKSRRK